MPRRRREACEGGKGGRPVQRNAANARERARMRILSRAFSRLKTTLPWVPADTKLSKLDTLRLATSYIQHLRQLLQEHPTSTPTPAPILTWPFSFPRGGEGGKEGGKEVGVREGGGGGGGGGDLPIINQQNERYFADEFQDYDYYAPDLLHLS